MVDNTLSELMLEEIRLLNNNFNDYTKEEDLKLSELISINQTLSEYVTYLVNENELQQLEKEELKKQLDQEKKIAEEKELLNNQQIEQNRQEFLTLLAEQWESEQLQYEEKKKQANQLHAELVESLSVNNYSDEENEIYSVQYYADLSIIILTFSVLLALIVLFFVNPIVNMLKRII